MVRPIDIRPTEPTEELRLDDGRVSPVGDPGPLSAGSMAEPAAGETATLGGGRRALLIGVALVAVVLAVAGLGFAGRSADTTASADVAGASADTGEGANGAPVSGAPADGATTGGAAGTVGAPDGMADAAARAVFERAGFPVEVDGLLVLSPERARREAGRDGAKPLAVAGWLSVGNIAPTACVIQRPGAAMPAADGPATSPGAADPVRIEATSPAADLCRRAAVLRSVPGESWGSPHIHLQALPGLSLAALPEDPGDGVPVVLIGHFRDGRALGCVPDDRNCGHEMVIDRVAWAVGRELPRSLVVSVPSRDAQPTRPPARAGSIVEFYGTLPVRTVSVLGLPGQDLHLIDPDAAAAVASRGMPPAIAWYVRFIVPEAVNGRVNWATGWAVVDDDTGRVIARQIG